MKKAKRRSDCPIGFALDIFGDRWSLLIIRDMMFYARNSYGEFLRSGEGIATNILADRLSALERTGIIKCSPDPENKSRRLYSLTRKGIGLVPVLVEIIKWSAANDQMTGAPPEFVKTLHSKREGFIKDLSERLMKQA